MRILHLGKYWRKDGGIETHVKTLCKGLAATGFDVVNLVSSVDSKASRFEHDGYLVVESPTLGLCCSTSIAPRMVKDARLLYNEKPFDVIHLHFPDPMSHMVSIALPPHVPRIITWHSDVVKQRKLLKLYRWFQLREIFRSKALVAATKSHFTSSVQIPESYPINQKHVIPYGMEFGWLESDGAVLKNAQKIIKKALGRFIVFALGRHVEYKGFGVLIDAVHRADAFLILGGEGPLTNQLQSRVRDLNITNKVCFAGRMSNVEVAAHYHACDVFCLPSITPNEAFGLVQIEAMACGKPVICTQLRNGVNEINPHGVTGLTVPPGDSVKLASAIEMLRLNKSLCKDMGANAKNHALSNFSASNMCKRHVCLYEQLKVLQYETL